MRRIAATFACVLLFCVPGIGQQTGLTDAQIRSADIEVPQLVQLLELKPGMAVADVGAGFGAWTMRFARWLGPAGRVYATDVGSTQLAALRDIVERDRLSTVTVLEGAIDATNLPAACCDAILIRDAYHHFTQPEAMIRSLAASLKPGGRLAVIDFPPRANSEVPAGVPANRGGHGVPPEVIQREVGGVLAHVRTIAAWSPTSQPDSLYLVLFRKP
jgi:precorrin-6B methylase 2